MTDNERGRVLKACKGLSLDKVSLPDEYRYASLGLAVVDSIFSIGVTYQATMAVVERVAGHLGLPGRARYVDGRWPVERRKQVGLTKLVALHDEYGATRMAEEIYKNRQRTSSSFGILKADAVGQMAQALADLGVETFQDVQAVDAELLEGVWRGVHGQKSGVSWRYFQMLTGRDDMIKPDRMILRFLKERCSLEVDVERAVVVLQDVAKELGVSARLLDYAIWNTTRQASVKPVSSSPLL